MHKQTNCPGEYLLSKMDYIVEEANKINNESISEPKLKVELALPLELVLEQKHQKDKIYL